MVEILIDITTVSMLEDAEDLRGTASVPPVVSSQTKTTKRWTGINRENPRLACSDWTKSRPTLRAVR
jgi:hypothetical protein